MGNIVHNLPNTKPLIINLDDQTVAIVRSSDCQTYFEVKTVTYFNGKIVYGNAASVSLNQT